MSVSERPRERMRQQGVRSLSDCELIAVILGNGKRGVSALTLARQIMSGVGNDLHELARTDLNSFVSYNGVGEVKGLRLMAALELGRRREAAFVTQKPLLAHPEDCAKYLRPIIGDLPYEEFHILCLNYASRLLGCHRISDGGVTSTIADAKRIFRVALQHPTVTSIVLAHNHPSGNVLPSAADIRLTKKLVAAAHQLDLSISDHLILGGRKFYSFLERGVLSETNDAGKRSG